MWVQPQRLGPRQLQQTLLKLTPDPPPDHSGQVILSPDPELVFLPTHFTAFNCFLAASAPEFRGFVYLCPNLQAQGPYWSSAVAPVASWRCWQNAVPHYCPGLPCHLWGYLGKSQ